MRRRKLLAVVVVNLLLTLVLLEAALQAVHFASRRFHSRFLGRIDEHLRVKSSWEEYFLHSYLTETSIVYAGIHRPHPTRGWAMKPSVRSSPESGITFTTNRQGYRALYDYENDPDRYQVVILGDSFTFGDEIDDELTWPALLQANNADLNVLNLAGSGYGIDQMLITLEEEIANYRPKLVICAFVSDDLRRSTMAFRDYKKPLFILQKKELVLTNTPIGDVDSVIDEIAAAKRRFYSYSHVQTINLLNGLLSDIVPIALDSCPKPCRDLNEALIDRMDSVAKTNGAEFLLLYLPWGDEIRDREARAYGEAFFLDYVGRRGVLALNPRGQMLNARFDKVPGHYMRSENVLLSTIVMAKISGLDSWKLMTSSRER